MIACGALAREIVALRRANDWPHLDVQCLPADLHNHPRRIPGAVRDTIRANRGRYASIFVAYGDCGTGGELDAMLSEERVERIPGAHCYEFFAGSARSRPSPTRSPARSTSPISCCATSTGW